MRIVACFYKHDEVRFVSHLDMQRLFQRAFRRAGLPLSYSKGFNPHPLLSFATALSVGYTSECEYFDVTLDESISIGEFCAKVNAVLPAGVRITAATDAGESKASLTTLMRRAEYDVKLHLDACVKPATIDEAIGFLLNDEIIVQKKTKGGIKPTDIRPQLISIELLGVDGNEAELHICGKLTAEGGLPLELLIGALYERLGVGGTASVNRTGIEMDWAVMS